MRSHSAFLAGVCLKGTLFTPLSRTTSTQSLNVQLRRSLDLYINLVAGFNLPNVTTRQKDLDIVVIRCVTPWRKGHIQSPCVCITAKTPRVSTAGWSMRWCRVLWNP